MSERLKLTEEDIAEAQRAAQAAPPTPAVLTIGLDDLSGEVVDGRTRGHVLRISEADLTTVPAQHTNTPNLTELETLMFGLLNSARQAHLPRWLGSPNLRWHAELAAVARGHAADMLKRGYVDHVSPEGTQITQRIEQVGIRYMACGENIGIVYGDASHSAQGIYDVHEAFMIQPRRLTNHRGNLLNPIWTHVGIGVAYDTGGRLIVTQNFICKP